MTIMVTLTMLRPAKDVERDNLGDIVDNNVGLDDHDDTDNAWFKMLIMTFTMMLMLLRHEKMLIVIITLTLTHLAIRPMIDFDTHA